jgi:signal transduction histidine kinase
MSALSSLRGRLVLAAVAVGLVFAALFGTAATIRMHGVQDRAIRSALLSRLDVVRDEVRPDGTLRPDRGSAKTDLIQVIGPDGRVRTASRGLAGLPPLVDIRGVRAAGSDGVMARRPHHSPDIDLAALGVPFDLRARGASHSGTGALVVAVDAEGFAAASSDLVSLMLVGLFAVVVAIALLAWVLTGRALRAVARLTEEAEAVNPSGMASGLPVPGRDAELARLVKALNRMLARLHEGHSREMTFAADAGHRLRTPVATLRAEAEIALRDADPQGQSAALRRIVDDADQLSLIVDRMLARVRSRTQVAVPVTEAFEQAAARWGRQADLAGVALVVHVAPELSGCAGDADVIDVVDPLADNAIRHSSPGGRVSVCVRVQHERLVTDVVNTGVGVPADVSPRIFDAWVSSRDATQAGGLGLWLARETARDLGGDVTLLDGDPGTTTFRVSAPLGSRPGGR